MHARACRLPHHRARFAYRPRRHPRRGPRSHLISTSSRYPRAFVASPERQHVRIHPASVPSTGRGNMLQARSTATAQRAHLQSGAHSPFAFPLMWVWACRCLTCLLDLAYFVLCPCDGDPSRLVEDDIVHDYMMIQRDHADRDVC